MADVRTVTETMAAAVAIERGTVERRSASRADGHEAEHVRRLGDGPGFRHVLRMPSWPEEWQGTAMLVRPGPAERSAGGTAPAERSAGGTAPAEKDGPAGRSDPWRAARLVGVTVRTATCVEFVLQLDTPLPAEVPVVSVRPDEAARLRQVTERLRDLSAAEPDGVRLALETIGLRSRSPSVIERDVTAGALAAEGRTWNADQERAVGQALGSDLTFLWAPPGTGRSEVLAAVVDGCYRQGHRVLLVAPTHQAVDRTLLRVCERLRSEPAFERGLVQRLTGARLPLLAERFGASIDPSSLEHRLRSTLAADVRAAREERARVLAASRDAEVAAVLARRLEELRLARRTAGILLAQAEGRRDEQQALVERMEEDLGRARRSTGVAGAWRRRTLERVEQDCAYARRSHEDLVAEVAEVERRIGALDDQITELEAEHAAVPAGAAGPPPDADALAVLLHSLDSYLAEAEAAQGALQGSIRSVGRITAATVAEAVAASGAARFDTVVVDEAAMVDLAQMFCVTALARRRVVVAGDFRQLAMPVRTSPDRLERGPRELFSTWYARDVFAAGGVVTANGAPKPDPRLVHLSEQYRMRPAICELADAVTYPDAPLRTGRDDVSRLPASALLRRAVTVIDTSGPLRAGGRTTNPVHAAVVREVVRALQYDGVLPARDDPAGDPTATLGVLTPYRDQARILEREVRERFGRDVEPLVDTLQGFRGRRRPVVVLDLVASARDDDLGPFYRGVGPASETNRLLALALTRAQDHLIVVADLPAFAARCPAGTALASMVDHLRDRARIVPVAELIPTRSAAELTQLGADELSRPAFVPADQVFEALAWDVARAQEAIHLYCPALGTRATRHWLVPLRQAADRGVRVVVSTRPHGDDPVQAELVAELLAAGVDVTARESMHERIVIVDEVLWHGSLNLLADARSTELMLRTTGHVTREEVRRILDRVRVTRPLVAQA